MSTGYKELLPKASQEGDGYQRLGGGEDLKDDYDMSQPTVVTQDLRRSYGSTLVLHGMNMTVPSSKIYGLLGPSGCGKTTLLKCILGGLDVHGGTVKVFGRAPGEKNHPIPGHLVGYMPQDIAIAPEFSISESLEFYSKVHGMKKRDFEERKNFLLRFLDMPDEKRLIKNLSGGQQRRVSLCCALIHSPRLLILDEPTVGVDPMLRSRIWHYLRELADSGTAVIITTHYIEEARQADVCGLMRNGHLLAEGNPQDLLSQYRKSTLEETFLALCFDQDGSSVSGTMRSRSNSKSNSKSRDRNASHSDSTTGMVAGPITGGSSNRSRSGSTSSSAAGTRTRSKSTTYGDGAKMPKSLIRKLNPPRGNICTAPPRCRILNALNWRAYKRLKRNVGFLMFQFLLPSIQVILFCLAIGKAPTDLPFAILMQDQPTADRPPLGEWFAGNMSHSNTFDIKYVHTLDQGIDDVRHGKAWGVLHIPTNFTNSLAHMDINKHDAAHLHLDMTNQQIAITIEQKAFVILEDLFANVLHIKTLPSPLILDQPIYGERNPSFTDFIAPGIIISISFSQAIALTAIGFVIDKKSGLLERAWAAGVRPVEIMLSHFLVQFVLLLIQISLLLFFALLIFELPMEGSLVLVFVLSMALGMAGMAYGMVISSFVDNEESAMQVALGSFFPSLLLSGVIWPLQGIPVPLVYLSYALPTTWAAEAMRSIMSRGWGVEEDAVWQGLSVTTAWVVFLFFLALLGVKSRS